MTKINWQRASDRSRAARNGTEDITDYGLPRGLTPPRKRASKTQLQSQINAAKAQISRSISCACGHAATVMIPQAKRHARLKCSICGEYNQ